MALSGSCTTTVDTSYDMEFWGELTWTATQNQENNISTISWKLYARTNKSSTGWTRGVTSKIVKINGNEVFNNNTRISYYGGQLITSGTTIVPHNDDGTKTLTYSVSLTTTTPKTLTGSGSTVLTPIPRDPCIYVYNGTSWKIGKPYACVNNAGTTASWQQAKGSELLDDIKIEGVAVYDGTTWKSTITKG